MASVAPNHVEVVLVAQFRTRVGLARVLGVSRTTVNRWIDGEEPVPVARRGEIADLLGVPVDLLFPQNGVVA